MLLTMNCDTPINHQAGLECLHTIGSDTIGRVLVLAITTDHTCRPTGEDDHRTSPLQVTSAYICCSLERLIGNSSINGLPRSSIVTSINGDLLWQ